MEPFPKCRQCGDGELVPLSDFSNQGASLKYKAWVCTNVDCGYNVKIRSGEIVVNEPVNLPGGRANLREVPGGGGHNAAGYRRGHR